MGARPGAPGPRPPAVPATGGRAAAGDRAEAEDRAAAGDAEVAQVLADLAATPAGAPPLEQAAALERAQERLARRLSGAAR